MQRFQYVLLVASLVTPLACAPPANVGKGRPGPKTPVNAGRPLEDTWDAAYIEQAKVGHVHTYLEADSLERKSLLRIKSDTSLTMERFGETIKQKISILSVESLEGELASFECRMSAGPDDMIARGEVVGTKLHISSETKGKSLTREFDWDKSWGGFFAVEQSLRDRPLQAGQSRELRVLMPDLPFPSARKTTLEALDIEKTELLDGPRELLKIKQTVFFDEGNKIESFVWVDEQGETLKVRIVSGEPFTSYRTTKEVALRESDRFDLGYRTTVKVARPLKSAHLTKRVVYRARLKEGDPLAAFKSGPSQSVKSIDKQTAEVVVRAIRPDIPEKLETPDAPPTDDDLAPNNLIQSDDKKVVAIAKGAAPDEQDPWKLAVALEKHIKKSIKSVNFSQAFATAAETAESLEGDCTEHAMLLAAVCRARKLPARVAVGLVYDGKSGFAFHMWTEVWIADRWIPLDATLGQGGIGGAHLKLAHSNLKVSSITSALFPVFNVLGRLELEIVEAE